MSPYFGTVAGMYAPPPVHPVQLPADATVERARQQGSGDPHLRSARAINRYSIRARDGDLGHVSDYLIDLEDWSIRYLIVDPRSWWPGAHVLIPPDWVEALREIEWVIEVDVTRETIRNAPRYDATRQLDREFEAGYWRYFGRAPYWDRSPLAWRL